MYGNLVQRRKDVDSSYAKQPDKPKSVARVLGGAVSKNYRHHYYDTPKYAVHVFGGAVSKTYRRFPESRVYRYIITTSVARVLGGAVSKNYRHHYYDTPKYAVHVFGGAVSKTYRRFPESRVYRYIITTLSRTQVVTTEAA